MIAPENRTRAYLDPDIAEKFSVSPFKTNPIPHSLVHLYYSFKFFEMPEDLKAAHDLLFTEGMKVRKEVLGSAHVEQSMNNVSDFSKPLQHFVTEACWGAIWTRPGTNSPLPVL